MSSRSPYGNYAYAMLTANARRTPDKRTLTAALESNDIKRSCSSNQLNFI